MKREIEGLQEDIVQGLCGAGYTRAGSYTKPLVTSIGKVRIRVQRMRVACKESIETFSPILDALDIKKKVYANDVRMKCSDLASVTSYGKASEQFEKMTGIHVPKRTIHAFVQQIAPILKEENRKHVQSKELEHAVADGTKTHSIYKTKNEVNVIIGSSNGEKVLLAASVNREWKDVGMEVNGILNNCDALVRDADRSIATNVADKTEHQLDLVHAVKETMIKLWSENMPKDERDTVSRKMSGILFTLVSSVRKHLDDGDIDAMKKRIEYTLEELKDLSKELKRNDYVRASEFIRKNARLMVTFAKLATESIRIPYTSNVIERLMGEVARRCKHIWAHWSTKGLENMLQILLVKYCSPRFYEQFYKAYIAGMYN